MFFVNLKSFTYGGGTYSFISPIEAIIKASELDYRSDASKNIIFVQNSDTFSYDKCESFNFEEIIKALLDKNINFYGLPTIISFTIYLTEFLEKLQI